MLLRSKSETAHGVSSNLAQSSDLERSEERKLISITSPSSARESITPQNTPKGKDDRKEESETGKSETPKGKTKSTGKGKEREGEKSEKSEKGKEPSDKENSKHDLGAKNSPQIRSHPDSNHDGISKTPRNFKKDSIHSEAKDSKKSRQVQL